MKRKAIKWQLVFHLSLFMLNIGCNAIIHVNPYASKYIINLKEEENLDNVPVVLGASKIEVIYMYDSNQLGNNTIWSVASLFDLYPSMRQTLVGTNEFEFDSKQLSKASIDVQFIGDRFSLFGTNACSGQRMISINTICTNYKTNGFGGDSMERCYYLDVNYDSNSFGAGTMRFKYTIEPVYD